jgi:hypothetical protein
MPKEDTSYGSRRKGSKKKQPVKKSNKPIALPPNPARQSIADLLPPDVSPINLENRLHSFSPGMREDATRPWYMFDFVDPGPKYRDRPDGFTGDFISEGGENDYLYDEPGKDRVPIFVPGYQ